MPGDLQQYDIDNKEQWVAEVPIMFAVAEAFFTDPAAKWSALRRAKGNRAACRTLVSYYYAVHPLVTTYSLLLCHLYLLLLCTTQCTDLMMNCY